MTLTHSVSQENKNVNNTQKYTNDEADAIQVAEKSKSSFEHPLHVQFAQATTDILCTI